MRPIRTEDDDLIAAFPLVRYRERTIPISCAPKPADTSRGRFTHIDYANEVAFIGIARRNDHEDQVGVVR